MCGGGYIYTIAAISFVHVGVLLPVELPPSAGSKRITTSLPPGVLLLIGSNGTTSPVPTPTSCHLLILL
jgi:hypothetical protein